MKIFSIRTVSSALLNISCLLVTTGVVNAQPWTLERSITKALQVAPQMKLTQAEIRARKNELGMAGAWPNPDIEIRVDNNLELAKGRSGYGLSEVTINQPIPFGRLDEQQAFAQSRLDAAGSRVPLTQLEIERDIALMFHELQLAEAQYTLARESLATAQQYLAGSDSKHGKLIRYQSPLEKMRLKIILEQAKNSITHAEGKYSESLSQLAQYLYIDTSEIQQVATLEQFDFDMTFEQLRGLQENHPAFAFRSQQISASSSMLQLERSRVLDDPTVSLSHGKDNYDTGDENVYAVMLNVQLPLWNEKTPAVSDAEYDVTQQQIELGRTRQELSAELSKSFQHLEHLQEQIAHHKKDVLVPAKQMFALTRKGFNSGEFDVLTLIDANNTYFETQQSYQQFLYDASVELAHLRYAAGMLVTAQGGE